MTFLSWCQKKDEQNEMEKNEPDHEMARKKKEEKKLSEMGKKKPSESQIETLLPSQGCLHLEECLKGVGIGCF